MDVEKSRFSDIGKSLNIVAGFLARRDIEALTREELRRKYGIEEVDLIILLGNSIPFTAELAAEALKEGIAPRLMVSGGIGHSTDLLINNVKSHPIYKDIDTEGKSEAEILNDILVRHLKVDKDKIILESKSTNCGANAREAFRAAEEKGMRPRYVLLIQDPTMQLRSSASFEKEWRKGTVLINFSPFIPEADIEKGFFKYKNTQIHGVWEEERFVSLLLGEIPRLRDDEQGYGPRGKGFISHVEIPEEVIEAYSCIERCYSHYKKIRNENLNNRVDQLVKVNI